VNPTLRCTHCGRKIPRDECARVRLTKTDTIEGIEVVCVCASHRRGDRGQLASAKDAINHKSNTHPDPDADDNWFCARAFGVAIIATFTLFRPNIIWISG